MTNLEHWKLYTYDVWGGGPDDEDAEWNVNDVYFADTVEIPEDATDAELVNIVKPIFRADLQPRIEVAPYDDGLEVVYFQLDNGYPLCELRRA